MLPFLSLTFSPDPIDAVYWGIAFFRLFFSFYFLLFPQCEARGVMVARVHTSDKRGVTCACCLEFAKEAKGSKGHHHRVCVCGRPVSEGTSLIQGVSRNFS